MKMTMMMMMILRTGMTTKLIMRMTRMQKMDLLTD